MGGGGGNNANSAPTRPIFMNPLGGVLANLFGVGTSLKNGGINLVNPNITTGRTLNFSDPLNPAFGQGSFNHLADLLNPIPMQGFESGTAGVGQAGLDMFNQQTLPAAQEALSSGFRTNMDPVIANAMRQFQRDIVPNIAEKYGAQTGTFSSDFLNSITQAGGDLSSQLGAMQAQMDEAASQRRLQALLGGVPNIPGSVGTSLLNLGQALRGTTQSASPGGQILSLMQALSGVVPTGATTLPNSSQSYGSNMNIMSGSSNGSPSLDSGSLGMQAAPAGSDATNWYSLANQ